MIMLIEMCLVKKLIACKFGLIVLLYLDGNSIKSFELINATWTASDWFKTETWLKSVGEYEYWDSYNREGTIRVKIEREEEGTVECRTGTCLQMVQ